MNYACVLFSPLRVAYPYLGKLLEGSISRSWDWPLVGHLFQVSFKFENHSGA